MISVRNQESEVEGHGGAILLRDQLKSAIALGHDQVVRPTVSEDADFSQIGCEVVPTCMLLSWLRLSTDHKLAALQLLILDLDNLLEVLDPWIGSLQFSLSVG